MSQMSVYDKFSRGAALTDFEVITLIEKLKPAIESLKALESKTTQHAVKAFSEELNLLQNILVVRSIGYQVKGNAIYAAYISYDQKLCRSSRIDINGYNSWAEWLPITKAFARSECNDVTTMVARSIAGDFPLPEGFLSLTDYLYQMLPKLYKKIFGTKLLEEEVHSLVLAHNDKSYQYHDVWNETGIHEYRGSLLYLLTYTELMKLPKHQSEWAVIEFHSTYIDRIMELENEE